MVCTGWLAPRRWLIGKNSVWELRGGDEEAGGELLYKCEGERWGEEVSGIGRARWWKEVETFCSVSGSASVTGARISHAARTLLPILLPSTRRSLHLETNSELN